jgi:hypothetical protein
MFLPKNFFARASLERSVPSQSHPAPYIIRRDKDALPYYAYAGNLFLMCFTVAVWSTPLTSQPASRPYDPATQKGSVSGRISSIGDASFSVDVKKSQDLVTLRFLIDDTAEIDGRLEIGSATTVEYHTGGGNNIATHVVVPSAVHSY